MTIQELMEKRAKVWEVAKNFVDAHENENGVLSAEDSATYERMEAEIEDLTKAIDRHRKAEEMEKNRPAGKPAADPGSLMQAARVSQRQDVLLMNTAGQC